MDAASSVEELEVAESRITKDLVQVGGGGAAGGPAPVITPAGPQAAADVGEAAVDEERLARVRAVLVTGAKFSGTIEIPGIHDGVDEQDM